MLSRSGCGKPEKQRMQPVSYTHLLADAEFFYNQDCKETLESRLPGLHHVVYHNKLGSQAERMLRVKALAGMIAKTIGADVTHAERAAMLAKADLRTLMAVSYTHLF